MEENEETTTSYHNRIFCASSPPKSSLAYTGCPPPLFSSTNTATPKNERSSISRSNHVQRNWLLVHWNLATSRGVVSWAKSLLGTYWKWLESFRKEASSLRSPLFKLLTMGALQLAMHLVELPNCRFLLPRFHWRVNCSPLYPACSARLRWRPAASSSGNNWWRGWQWEASIRCRIGLTNESHLLLLPWIAQYIPPDFFGVRLSDPYEINY